MSILIAHGKLPEQFNISTVIKYFFLNYRYITTAPQPPKLNMGEILKTALQSLKTLLSL